jgi:PAS domain S-box-containing protein
MTMAYHNAPRMGFDQHTDLENIFNGINHGIVVVDQHLKISRANSAIAEMIGRKSHDLIGTSYERLRQEMDLLGDPSPVEEALTTGKVTHAVKQCQAREQQSDRFLKISCFPQKDQNSQVTHAIVYIRDVSEMVRAEMLQKDFAHMIVHDIRNPILAAVKTLELSVEGTHGWTESHHREMLARTRDSCELLLDMLDDMLDVYAHESGQLRLNPQRINVSKFIHKAYKAIETLVHEKALRVIFDLPEQGLLIYGDEPRLIRVMINLLDNSVKFSPKNSTVLVNAQFDAKGRLRVSVCNQGKCIPREYLDRIFWKFYQVDRETGIKKAGVGLGLAFCRIAIEAHGGKIWAESPVHADGSGSRFIFTIPGE